MSDRWFYLKDAVHILRSNGTTEHADACQQAYLALQNASALVEAAAPFAEHALGINPALLNSDLVMRETTAGLDPLRFSDFRKLSAAYTNCLQNDKG